ncbi:MAG: hypothetical protein GY754_12585 [bacterium]|nr:hypothetical protein [bacterium]
MKLLSNKIKLMACFFCNLIVCCLCCTFFFQENVYAAEKKRVAVLNFSANNIAKSYSKIIRDTIERSLIKTKRFNILERSMIELVVREKKPGALDCIETMCAVQIGEFVSADYVIIGSIDAEKTYTLIVRIVDVRSNKIVKVNSKTYDSKEDMVKGSPGIGDSSADTLDVLIPGDDSAAGKEHDSSFDFYGALSGGYVMPVSTFSQLVYSGFAVSIYGGVENLFFENFLLVLESGYYRFPGKDDDVRYVSMIPVLFCAGYSLYVLDDFYLLPSLSFGAVAVLNNKINGAQSGIEPLLKLSLDVGYRFNSLLKVRVGASYNKIFEEDGEMDFLSFNAGVGIIF